MPSVYRIEINQTNARTLILPCENEDLWSQLTAILDVEFTNFEQFSTALQSLVKLSYSPNDHNEKIDFSLLKNYLSKPENSEKFFSVQLPTIINLFKQMPVLFQDHISNQNRIPLLIQMIPNTVVLSRSQVASLLASQFLCVANKQYNNDQAFPNPNFFILFLEEEAPNEEKLGSILNYFERVSNGISGNLSIVRSCLSLPPNLSAIDTKLATVTVHNTGRIEETNNAVKMDFANAYLGGGVLHGGCAQEEILFTVCPELLVSMNICATMTNEEAVHILGAEQFSNYIGYGFNFKNSGNYNDTTEKDESGTVLSHFVAFDAIPWFSSREQFTVRGITRELNKAYIAFSKLDSTHDKYPHKVIATGNWGCGAFGGNLQLKFIIQYLAASAAGVDLEYFTFNITDASNVPFSEAIETFINFCINKNITTAKLWDFLLNNCDELRNQQATLKGHFDIFAWPNKPKISTYFLRDRSVLSYEFCPYKPKLRLKVVIGMGNGNSNNTSLPQLTLAPNSNGYRNEFLWKVVVVGDSATGKDVSGAARYGQLTRSFYQGALGAVVVLDVNKSSSIQEAANWAADIHKKLSIPKTTKFPMILLGNKVDMLDESRRDVIKLELENLAKNNGFMGWWLVSAKDAYNLERPFSVLMKKIYKLQNRWPAVLQSQVFPPQLDVLKPMYDEYERNFKQQQIATNETSSTIPEQQKEISTGSIRDSNEFDEFEREDEFAEQSFGEEYNQEYNQNATEPNELPTPDVNAFSDANQNGNIFNSSDNNLFAASEDGNIFSSGSNLFAEDDSALFATDTKSTTGGEDVLFGGNNNTSKTLSNANPIPSTTPKDIIEDEFIFETKTQPKEIEPKTIEQPKDTTSSLKTSLGTSLGTGSQETEKFSDLFSNDKSTGEAKSVSELFSKPSRYSYNSSLFDDIGTGENTNSSANDSIFKLDTSSSAQQRKANLYASKKKTSNLFGDDDLFGSDDKGPLF